MKKYIAGVYFNDIRKLNIYYTQGDHCNRPGFSGTVQTFNQNNNNV
jgi:hypothetical protein